MSASRTPQPPAVNRAALAPGLLGAIVLLAGLGLLGGEWYLFVQYGASILALILCVFAGQARAWWWLAGLIPLAIVFNPVLPLPIDETLLRVLHVAGAVLFVCAGILIKIPADGRR